MNLNKSTFFWILLFATKMTTAQIDSLSEYQWKQIAKANYVCANENRKALTLILSQEPGYVLDSLSCISIFSEIRFKGSLIRTAMKIPMLEGKQEYYYFSGKHAANIQYEKNNYHGLTQFFYPNGSIYSEKHYCKNLKCLTWLTYYPNGSVCSKIIYEKDLKVVDSTFYLDGSLSKVYYQMVKPVTKKNTIEEYDITKHSKVKSDLLSHFTYQTKYYNEGKEISRKEHNQLSQRSQLSTVKPILDALPEEPNNMKVPEAYLIKYYGQICPSISLLENTIPLMAGRQDYTDCREFSELRDYSKKKHAYSSAHHIDSLYCSVSRSLVRSASTYKGMLHGALRFYYPNGKLMAEYLFKQDKREGDFAEYFENGILAIKGRYRDNCPVDTTFEYFESGKVESLTIWSGPSAFEKIYFWDDGMAIQRKEIQSEIKVLVKLEMNQKEQMDKVLEFQAVTNFYYFDEIGNEISEKRFNKVYPGILPEKHISRFQF
jgi:antitoxin component YwqK of YwqJK toxin-antitoxin module